MELKEKALEAERSRLAAIQAAHATHMQRLGRGRLGRVAAERRRRGVVQLQCFSRGAAARYNKSFIIELPVNDIYGGNSTDLRSMSSTDTTLH